MWYVMQVVSGREVKTALMLERSLSGKILGKCFIPMRRMKKKYHGEWREDAEKLFPGYVFLSSEKPQLLFDELKNIPALTKLLGSCEESFTPLTETDVRFLRKLQFMMEEKGGGRKKESFVDSEVGISQVALEENGQIRIVSGPLKNLKGQIRKINLHKRIAVVEAEFMGNQSLIHLGVEIINKR